MLCYITCLSECLQSILEKEKSIPNQHYPTLSLTCGRRCKRDINDPNIRKKHKMSCTHFVLYNSCAGSSGYYCCNEAVYIKISALERQTACGQCKDSGTFLSTALMRR